MKYSNIIFIEEKKKGRVVCPDTWGMQKMDICDQTNFFTRKRAETFIFFAVFGFS